MVQIGDGSIRGIGSDPRPRNQERAMFKKTLIAAGALVAAATVSLPAQAGPGFSFGISGPQGSVHFSMPGHPRHAYNPWRHRHVLSTRAVTRQLHRQGFHRIHSLQRQGHVYVARAQQRRGQRVQVVLNAYTGQVISVRRIW
jgi:hypothetical protein